MKTEASFTATTLHQVAQAAGVSPATVSRFLNGTAKVADDKRRTLERVIEELNYKPNRLAQGLKMGSSRTIGVLTQSLESGYFNRAMVGIEDAVKASGYALLIMSGHWHADEEAERVELLIARRVDGVAILTGKLSDSQILGFSKRVPIVAFGRQVSHCHDTASAEIYRHALALPLHDPLPLSQQQRASDRQHLSLTARQRCNVAVFEAGEIDCCQGALRGCTVVRAFPGPEIEVWVTPDEHGLERRCRKRIVDQLRQQTQRACEFTARP